MEHEQDISVLGMKPDISVPTGPYILLLYWTEFENMTGDWLAMLSGQFKCSVNLQFKYQHTWHGSAESIWQPVPRPIFIPLEIRLCQKRSRHAFNCVPSLRSFLNQPPQMNHHCWVMLNYSSPSHLKCHLDNLLVHLSLHSCEGRWSFWSGNWLVNHVSVTFFLENQIGGNYDALQFCITYLPSSLASSPPSRVVLGFCPFHLVFRVLNFCRVTWSKDQRQFVF